MNAVNIIHPSALTNEWLHSEYVGIIRLIEQAKLTGDSQISNIPLTYPMDKGRVKFFYDKLKFLSERHEAVKVEISKRKKKSDKFPGDYDLSIDTGLLSQSYPELYNDWTPHKRDYSLDTARLYAKWLLRKRTFSYYGVVYSDHHDWTAYSAKIINRHSLDLYQMRDVFKVVEVNTLLKSNKRLPL